MRASEIRSKFLGFFVERGHREVASSSLVPEGDPTLLFTNAGMVQFKRVFQGLERRDYKRATTAQKCVRAGGKHNDLEQVGHTDRHLTFFEMLGNFSFGDYFKKEAIGYAWEFVTSEQYLGIKPDLIRISVHKDDADARRLWRDVAGVANERIYGLGDKDNFWQMADTGPCGPCSEIFLDLGKVSGRESETLATFIAQVEAGRFVELWNLVFMQFDRRADGKMVPLPEPSVDTGCGLDRTAAVLQGELSIFHSDLFLPLIARVEAVVGQRYDRGEKGASFRVLADHARAVSFLLADGVYPSNEGRGYVLRRILRRAVRHAYLLGRREPTLVPLTDVVVNEMGGQYPELVRSRSHIADVTRAEEERFLETIEGGLGRLAELKSVSAEEAFKLYDTYGFPIDLTQIVAEERGLKVDVAGFDKLLDKQRDRSRQAARRPDAPRGSLPSPREPSHGELPGRLAAWQQLKPRAKQKFIGYDAVAADTDVLAFQQSEGRLGLVLHENPFYAESGGQVSDAGLIVGKGWKLPVDEVRKVEGKTAVFGPFSGPFEPTNVHAQVEEQRRRDTERNHTATHLVHAALRKVLGAHVHQAGSVVAPDRLRFDFSHHAPVGPGPLAEIEHEVNAHVWENIDIETREMKYDAALKLGAMALFGEKYGDVVRVVLVSDVSKELCGGTHVRTTGQIGLVKFIHETGVGANVRRVEALTGPGAFAWFAEQRKLLEDAASTLGSAPEHLARRAQALAEEQKKLQKRVEELIKGGGAATGANVSEENGTVIAVTTTAATDRNEIGAMVDAFRARTKSGVLVIFANGDRPGIHVGLTDDLVARGTTAPTVVNKIAELAGGKGGGRPYFASAGAVADRLAIATERADEIVRSILLPRSE
jgi:alanyl-tRNA synthetase